MGNPAWGHGFRKGLEAGLAQGRTEGAVAMAGLAALAATATYTVVNLKHRRQANKAAPENPAELKDVSTAESSGTVSTMDDKKTTEISDF